MARSVLGHKYRQIFRSIHIERHPRQPTHGNGQVTCSGQTQMALKAIIAKSEGQAVWWRQPHRIRS